MKKLLLLLLLIPALSNAQNKDSWELFLTMKKMATGIPDNDTLIKIPKSTVGFLKINYTNGSIVKNWKRHFLIMDEKNQTLLDTAIKSMSGSIAFDLRKLKALTKKDKFMVYTVGFPNDPNVAATVRLRRIILFTVQWK